MPDFQIAASILSADLTRLGEEIKAVSAAGADLIHVDVMDNHYVPNLTFGPLICESIRKAGFTIALDVHLMVKPVDALITAFANAGATTISFHPEASEHVDRSLQLIRDSGCRAGLVLNPATPLNYLDYVLTRLDHILIMSVNPGFAGQEFIPQALSKIRLVKKLIRQGNDPITLAVDGGVNLNNIREIAVAGADTFIMGSAIFAKGNYPVTIAAMRAELNKAIAC